MNERINFLKKPENIIKGNLLFDLFESGDETFVKNINIFIRKQNWKDKNNNPVNNFSGSLWDFLELAESNGTNKITVLRTLKLLAENNYSIEKTGENMSQFLPLAYVNIMNKDGQLEGELWQNYEHYWNDLPLEERKFYKFNDEIVVDRQSPDPQKQAVVEAVSNALDAMREIQIGEKGLGVKQFFSFLEQGGSVQVKSKKQDGVANELKVVKGADKNYYEKIKKIDKFPSSSGTIVSLDLKEELPDERIKEIEDQIKYTFRLTLGVQVILNDKAINSYDKIKNLSGEQASEYQATKIVRVTINKNKIEIIDGGVGMDEKTLSTMFVARAGTKEMRLDKDELKRELWLLEDEDNHGKIFFSRGMKF